MAAGAPGAGIGTAVGARLFQTDPFLTLLGQGVEKGVKVAQTQLPKRFGTVGQQITSGARQLFPPLLGQKVAPKKKRFFYSNSNRQEE